MNLKKHFQNIKNIIHKLREKRGQCISLKQEQPMKANGLVVLEMEKEYKYGLMVHNT